MGYVSWGALASVDIDAIELTKLFRRGRHTASGNFNPHTHKHAHWMCFLIRSSEYPLIRRLSRTWFIFMFWFVCRICIAFVSVIEGWNNGNKNKYDSNETNHMLINVICQSTCRSHVSYLCVNIIIVYTQRYVSVSFRGWMSLCRPVISAFHSISLRWQVYAGICKRGKNHFSTIYGMYHK